MIIRADDRGLMLIRQTEHARLCGEMARSWGNEHFEPVEPLERVAWAAAEHDNGGGAEAQPGDALALHLYRHSHRPAPGDLPPGYRPGDRPRPVCRPPGEPSRLLALLPPPGRRSRAGQRGAQDFLEEQRSVQRRLVDAMRADPVLRSFCEEPRLSTNRDLVFGWDTLSLFLCHGAA